MTYTGSHVGTEIFKFNTLDGSGVPGYGDSEVSFPLLYDSQGNDNVTFAAPHVENPSYPGTTIITCCSTGFYDGVDPPIFTGGTTALDWQPGMYVGAYGTFTVALAPAAPEASTWAMMLVGFGGLGFAALRRRVSVLRNSIQRDLKSIVSQISTASPTACAARRSPRRPAALCAAPRTRSWMKCIFSTTAGAMTNG